MALYAFKVDGSDNVVNAWSGSSAKGIPLGTVACSAADYAAVQAAPRHSDGSPAWRFTSGVLSPVADARDRATWSQTALDLNVGDPAGSVQLTLPDRPNLNAVRVVEFSSGHKVRCTFVNGVATLSIPTTKPTTFRITDSDRYRMANNLRVRVMALDTLHALGE